ncbi:MAG: hypothetical protein WDO69_00225 [Pseudomonadota bacterium]
MARRPAIRSIARAILLSLAFFGLMAGVSPRPAAAEPTIANAMGTDPSEALPPSRSVALDEYPPPSARRNLFVAGIASTAVWYGAAVAASFAWPDEPGTKGLRIPIAGPWVGISHTGCGGAVDCSKALVVVGAIATALDGIGQAAGLALTAEALFMPTREPRRAHAALGAKRSTGFEWRPSFDAGKKQRQLWRARRILRTLCSAARC